eukprot:SM000130S27100  [mRNA]  locus=s130:161655:163041:- [translate_table: standard]
MREQVRAAVVDEKRSKATAPTPTACDWLTERRRHGQGGRARCGRRRRWHADAQAQGHCDNCGWLPQALHRVRRGHSGHAAKQARHEDFAGGWTGIQLHRRFLNASKQHCRSPRRLDRPSVAPPILNSRKERCRSPRRVDRRSIAPPIPELKQRALSLFQPSVAPPIPELTQRALPFSHVPLHALCRQFASFAGVPSHMPVANMEQEGIVIALLVVLMMFIFLDVNIALDEELNCSFGSKRGRRLSTKQREDVFGPTKGQRLTPTL